MLLGFPPEQIVSHGTGISADGGSAAGFASGVGQPGFLWTREAGRNDFGITTGYVPAYGISGDGNFAVGGPDQGSPGPGRAYRWSQATGYEPMGPQGGVTSALDASFDGSVVVGVSRGVPLGVQRPFRWTPASGYQLLSQSVVGYARAVSGDGNVIVGETLAPDRAFVWTQAGGMQFLPSVTGTGTGLARGVNFDGTIIVGGSGPGSATGTMWINGVPQALVSAGANVSFTPEGVSDDGSVVCGIINAGGAGGLFAGVWTLATGVIPLSDYLAANGVSIPSDRQLATCAGVSGDGRSFVGDAWQSGNNAQAYIATVPAPGASLAFGVGLARLAARRKR